MIRDLYRFSLTTFRLKLKLAFRVVVLQHLINLNFNYSLSLLQLIGK